MPANPSSPAPPSLPPPPPGSRWSSRAGIAALFGLAILVAYLPVLSAGFIYDDLILVESNPNVASLGAAMRAFFEPLWAFQDPTGDFQNAYWRPLTVLTIALGRAWSGFDPSGYHWISILLHVLATAAAWRLAVRLLSSEVLGGAVGLLFALHPVHVESVAWIAAVNDPLHGLFAILAISAHLRWRDRGSQGWSIAAGAWLLASLLAKEQALSIVPILLVLDLVLGRFRAGEKADPFELLWRAYSGILVALGVYYIGRVIAYDGRLLAGFDQIAAGFYLGLWRSFQFRLEILGGFLELLFVPVDQAVFRMVRPVLPDGHGPWIRALVAIALWSIAVFWSWRRRARVALALLLVLPAAFSPVLASYESAGGFPISDRYLYVPVVFAGALIAWLAARVVTPGTAAGIVGIVAIVFGVKTFLYSRQFTDEERFFRQAVISSPDNPYARRGLGRVLLKKYTDLKRKEDLDEAAYNFLVSLKLGTDYGERERAMDAAIGEDATFGKKATALSQLINGTPREERIPDLSVTWTLEDRLQANMGWGWCMFFLASFSPEVDLDWSKVIFEDTIRMWPDREGPRMGLGRVLLEMGRLEEAEKELLEAVRLNRAYGEGWSTLGACLARQGRWDDARMSYKEALRFRPGNHDDMSQAAQMAINADRFDLAERLLDDARAVHPRSLEFTYLRGVLAAARGDLPGGLALFDQVLARQADHPEALKQKGKIHYQLGDVEAAVRALGRACELSPESFTAHRNMAGLLAETSGPEAALPYLRRAYALSPPDQTRQLVHVQLLDIVGNDIEALAQLAALDQGRRDYVHALDYTNRALALALGDFATPRERLTQLNYMRGRLLWGLKEPVAAVEAYRAVFKTDPDHFQAHHDSALILFYELGRSEEARPHAEAALERLDSLGGLSPDQVAAMRELLTSVAEAEPVLGPMPVLDDPEDG